MAVGASRGGTAASAEARRLLVWTFETSIVHARPSYIGPRSLRWEFGFDYTWASHSQLRALLQGQRPPSAVTSSTRTRDYPLQELSLGFASRFRRLTLRQPRRTRPAHFISRLTGRALILWRLRPEVTLAPNTI